MNHYHHPTSKKWVAMMQDKYKHIAEDATVTVDITAAEMAAKQY